MVYLLSTPTKKGSILQAPFCCPWGRGSVAVGRLSLGCAYLPCFFFHFAHLAFCAAAILARPAADIFLRGSCL